MIVLIIFYTGIATFNPMAASPLIGFGDPPKNIEINFSIIDMHGLDDDTIPYNSGAQSFTSKNGRSPSSHM